MTKRHKSDDVASKMLTDIFDKLWSTDAAAASIPCFVAADLSRIPRARDDSTSLATTEQILASLHEIKRKIHTLESTTVTRDALELSLGALRPSAPPPPPTPLPLFPHSLPNQDHQKTPSAPSLSQLDPASEPPSEELAGLLVIRILLTVLRRPINLFTLTLSVNHPRFPFFWSLRFYTN